MAVEAEAPPASAKDQRCRKLGTWLFLLLLVLMFATPLIAYASSTDWLTNSPPPPLPSPPPMPPMTPPLLPNITAPPSPPSQPPSVTSSPRPTESDPVPLRILFVVSVSLLVEACLAYALLWLLVALMSPARRAARAKTSANCGATPQAPSAPSAPASAPTPTRSRVECSDGVPRELSAAPSPEHVQRGAAGKPLGARGPAGGPRGVPKSSSPDMVTVHLDGALGALEAVLADRPETVRHVVEVSEVRARELREADAEAEGRPVSRGDEKGQGALSTLSWKKTNLIYLAAIGFALFLTILSIILLATVG